MSYPEGYAFLGAVVLSFCAPSQDIKKVYKSLRMSYKCITFAYELKI